MGTGRGKVVSGAKSSGVLRGALCWLQGCAAVVVLPFCSLLAEALSPARASRAAQGFFLLSPASSPALRHPLLALQSLPVGMVLPALALTCLRLRDPLPVPPNTPLPSLLFP